MNYIIWASPAVAIVAAIASGRMTTLGASLAGLGAALAVSLFAAPHDFGVGDAAVALARGAWIGWIIIPYILGGLFFWRVALRLDAEMTPPAPSADARTRRRSLFAACFLVGPFAEAATGFGVGIVGTMTLVRNLGVAAPSLLAFGLLSQTMILWGGMGSGTIVAAAFAHTDPTTLAVHASVFVLAFNALWLPLYWRLADRAGIAGGWDERAGEALWLCTGVAGAIVATATLGPETAMLAAYGPLIALRYLIDERPTRADVLRIGRRVAPFAALVVCLVLSRLVPYAKEFLEETWRLQPFPGTPAWSPLFHAGSWLLAAAVATGTIRRQGRFLVSEARAAWRIGRLAVLTIVVFAMLAELLSRSGVAAGLARGTFEALGRWSLLATTLLSALLGALANSGNAANGLFMPAQFGLALDAGMNVAAVVALQQGAAISLNLVSPVRLSIVCALADAPGAERDAYRTMLPFAGAAVLVLVVSAILIIVRNA